MRSTKLTVVCALAALLLAGALAQPEEKKGEEIALFNGKDLSGWTAYLRGEGAKAEDVWSVQDGVLHCKGKPVGYLRTREKYTNFILKLEWRWPNDSKPGNSGVLLRIVGEDKVWPKSIEAQLMNHNAGDFFTIGGFQFKTDPERFKGRRTAKMHPTNEKEQGEWNEYVIEVDGGDVTLTVNGLVQNKATDAEVVPGYIGLQSEGAPIEFRNVRLVPLDK